MTAGDAPTRVLHLIDTGGPGGAETVLAALVEALPVDDWQSRVIVPEVDWLHARLGMAGVETRVVPSRGSVDLKLLVQLWKEILQYRPALVHAHLLGAGVYGSLAAELAGRTPLVVTFHGASDVNPGDGLLWLKGKILSRSKNSVVYVSEHLGRHLQSLLGLPAHRGQVIHNGVRFVDRSRTGDLRRELELQPGDTLVGAVGNLREPKDYPNLLRAAEIARRVRPDLSFVVLGSGPPSIETPLTILRDELGLANRFRFLGFREDALEMMGDFDLFVSSSSSEGLPLATLEAMGMGLPVVLTACGGPTEIVRSEETGLLVPPSAPEALAAGILELASDRGRARRMAHEGQVDVRSRFSLDRMVEAYTGLYVASSPAR